MRDARAAFGPPPSLAAARSFKFLKRMIVPALRFLSAGRGTHDLGYIKTPLRVEPDVMRCEEISRFAGMIAAAEAGQKLAARIEDAHSPARGILMRRTGPRPHSSAIAKLRHIHAVRAVDRH